MKFTIILYHLLLSFSSIVISNVSFAQSSSTEHRGIDVIRFKSTHIADSIELLISLPKNHDSKKSWPVVYILDADYYFLQHLLSFDSLVARGQVMEAILVGIGYGTNFNTRAPMVLRDLTPTDLSPEDYEEDLIITSKELAVRSSGKAESFSRFIQDELFPFIDVAYKGNAQTLVYGNAYGGLFLCHMLNTNSQLFDRYVISSPLAWWDNNVVINSIGKKTELHTSIKVVMSVGSKEDKKLKESFERLSSVVKKYYPPVIFRLYQNEDSHTVIPLSYRDGLIALWRD